MQYTYMQAAVKFSIYEMKCVIWAATLRLKCNQTTATAVVGVMWRATAPRGIAALAYS